MAGYYSSEFLPGDDFACRPDADENFKGGLLSLFALPVGLNSTATLRGVRVAIRECDPKCGSACKTKKPELAVVQVRRLI
jgi:hypothetical protein